MDEKNEDYHYVGRSYGAFARAIPLPREVMGDKVKASYKDGILTVVLPKSAHAKLFASRPIPCVSGVVGYIVSTSQEDPYIAYSGVNEVL